MVIRGMFGYRGYDGMAPMTTNHLAYSQVWQQLEQT
jgi:hypothetical protein